MTHAAPIITADGSLTLHSERYDQTYHSVHGAVTESNHVFLEGAGVIERLATGNGGNRLRILEVGLGLGVNALLTAQAAQRFGTHVDYFGVEFDFQSGDVIQPVLAQFDPLAVKLFCSMVDQCRKMPTTTEWPIRIKPEPISLNHYFHLQIMPTDLNSALSLTDTPEVPNTMEFDAIYLDAFSPDTNPECWTPEILDKLSNTLVPGGKLATYCAKGSVRRALQNVGLTVTRRPGPPGKRECLAASA